ncbi:hypothetical protein T492DRAFT_1126228 [Pavlovales sp. CCMP2436]|nr:hypothetical protein T492DRAFT_1126228 [Pavlovales sp. CCMP2436]
MGEQKRRDVRVCGYFGGRVLELDRIVADDADLDALALKPRVGLCHGENLLGVQPGPNYLRGVVPVNTRGERSYETRAASPWNSTPHAIRKRASMNFTGVGVEAAGTCRTLPKYRGEGDVHRLMKMAFATSWLQMKKQGVMTFIEEYPVGDGRYIADLAVFKDGVLDVLVECVVTSPPSDEKLEYYEQTLDLKVIVLTEEDAEELGHTKPPSIEPPTLEYAMPKMRSKESKESKESEPEFEPEFEGDINEGDDDDDACMAAAWSI